MNKYTDAQLLALGSAAGVGIPEESRQQRIEQLKTPEIEKIEKENAVSTVRKHLRLAEKEVAEKLFNVSGDSMEARSSNMTSNTTIDRTNRRITVSEANLKTSPSQNLMAMEELEAQTLKDTLQDFQQGFSIGLGLPTCQENVLQRP